MTKKTIISNYSKQIWGKDEVALAVRKGIITEREYLEIVNEEYVSNASLEKVIAAKLDEINFDCTNTIENGIDVTTSVGTEHFSLTVVDQTNIGELGKRALQGSSVPYHSDGNKCRLFIPEEMIMVYQQSMFFVTSQTSYANLLRSQVKEMTDKEAVKQVKYGITQLNEENQTIFNQIIEQLSK